MQTILNDLEMLGGVQHSCLLAKGELKASTFPSMLGDNLAGVAKVFGQIFMGVDAMQRDHREIHVELEENLLLGFWLEPGVLLLLLTDKATNLALIKTTVRSAGARLLAKLAEVPSPSSLETSAVAASAAEVIETGDVIEEEPVAVAEIIELDEVQLEKLRLLLAEHIGPAARVVFGRAHNSWRVAQEAPLQLAERLAEFIDNDEKRADFMRRASTSLPD